MPTPPVSLEPRISDLVVESQIEATWDPTTEQTTHIRTAVGVSARRRRLKTEEIWKRKRILGRGAFGTVWLEERIASSGPSHGDESNLRAIKEIRKRAKISAYEFHRELEAIAKFSHQRFVHCFTRSLGWFESEESLFITMEYIKYGDLQHYLTKPFPEPEARQIALQIAEALQLMHGSGFAHRDLKPSNIMVFQKGPAWWVKLADFGISKRVEESTVLRTMEIGTRGFMAPEILGLYCPDDFDEEELEDDDDEGVHDALSYTPAVDLWALGEITHRLLTQKPAFIANKRLWSYVTKGTPFPANELQVAGTSTQGIKFVQEAMAASPKGRLTAEDAINHEWLENHEFIDEERSRSSTESDRDLHPSGMTVSDYEPSAEWTVTGRDSNTMAERSTEPSTVVPDEAPVALVGEALTVLPGEAATTIHDETDTFLSDEAPHSFPAEELAGKQAEATTEQRGEPSVISDDRKLPEGEFESLTLAESHSEAIQDDTSQTIVGDWEIPVTDSRNHPRRFSFPELPFRQEPPDQVSTDSVTDMTASPPQEELLATPLAHESLESSHQIENDTSQPIKRDLKSRWRGFKSPSKQRDNHNESRQNGIFGVPLRQGITYANVAISLIDEEGRSYVYGYIPIVVAKCGVFLKEKGTDVKGIFSQSGSERRIRELRTIFDSPDRYGKGMDWDGYTVHDAANILRRYLNELPEPVVPLDLYEKFREPLRGATRQAVGDSILPQFMDGFNATAAIEQYQRSMTELPPLNRQLLLYLLDLLAVFAAKSDENQMDSHILASLFQPAILSHPAHALVGQDIRLSQCVVIFWIENQDYFLIGM